MMWDRGAHLGGRGPGHPGARLELHAEPHRGGAARPFGSSVHLCGAEQGLGFRVHPCGTEQCHAPQSRPAGRLANNDTNIRRRRTVALSCLANKIYPNVHPNYMTLPDCCSQLPRKTRKVQPLRPMSRGTRAPLLLLWLLPSSRPRAQGVRTGWQSAWCAVRSLRTEASTHEAEICLRCERPPSPFPHTHTHPGPSAQPINQPISLLPALPHQHRLAPPPMQTHLHSHCQATPSQHMT